jgi:hypothetical protein
VEILLTSLARTAQPVPTLDDITPLGPGQAPATMTKDSHARTA